MMASYFNPTTGLVSAKGVGLPSSGSRPPDPMWPGGASLVLATFAPQQWMRPWGRTEQALGCRAEPPASLFHSTHSS
ncbi:MAG TPA: hypothetical protein DD706_16955 [Nitrospiraceae bacterium]|nr:hypothetical protein [Nitrospiraceae bacterium]